LEFEFVLTISHLIFILAKGLSFLVREVSNIYVRVPGAQELRDPTQRDSLLLSAHFDSVPTSKGVGDNALGVAAISEIALNSLEREPLPFTLLFNFNNVEENGVLGARYFLLHPLWKDVNAFINIDSMCPEGRVLLYRSRNGAPVQYEWVTHMPPVCPQGL
jgi:acetylornithine deacetylase/succinyl-diaminopimelate desuccinylase-like protein